MKIRASAFNWVWAAFLMASFWRAQAATIVAPASLTNRTYTISETSGNSVISFFSTNLYQWTRGTGLIETGYSFAKRATNTWNIAATKADGSLTTQIAFAFASATNGIVTLTVAAQARIVGTFFAGVAPVTPPPVTNGLAPKAFDTVRIQNSNSITGPSSYTIHFTGSTNGTFAIDLPGYGAGAFLYTPLLNTAHLVLTYTNTDLAGDFDDLSLEFKGASGSTTNSVQSGTQSVSGTVYPVEGTFTFTAANP